MSTIKKFKITMPGEPLVQGNAAFQKLMGSVKNSPNFERSVDKNAQNSHIEPNTVSTEFKIVKLRDFSRNPKQYLYKKLNVIDKDGKTVFKVFPASYTEPTHSGGFTEEDRVNAQYWGGKVENIERILTQMTQ